MGRATHGLCAVALLVACVAERSAFEPGLSFGADPGEPGFGELTIGRLSSPEVDDGTSPPAEALHVWTGGHEVGEGCRLPVEQPRVLGKLVREDREVRFEPRFPWVAGLEYTACLEVGGGRAPRTLRFALPAAEPAGAPRVAALLPDVEVIPANQLRFYVRFSEPMRPRDLAGKVRLLDGEGRPLVEPFVEIPHGLWDRDRRRLTLIVHPGRLKQGVGPRQALGPVFVPGASVTLEVAATLLSAAGVELEGPVSRSYRVGEPDRELPDPSGWRLEAPASTAGAVVLTFDEPMDGELVRSAVVVLRGDEPVAGEASVSPDGRVWAFAPATPWERTRYRIEVQRTVEDLAGNTVDRPFDLETADGAIDRVVTPTASSDPPLEFLFTPGGG